MDDSTAATATAAPIVEKKEPVPAPFSRLLNDDEVDQSIQGKNTKGKKSITQFVENSFASFDRRFLLFGGKKKNSENDKDGKEEDDDGKPKKTKEEQDEDDAYATFTYLAILTALYLPFLLFLWIRRNVFGTASLVRSLFLGHMLRFGVAFMLLPPSTTRSFVPKRVWNVGVKIAARLERLWKDKRVQAFIPTWVHFCLTLILGVQTDPLHTTSSNTNNHSGAISMGMGGGILNVSGGSLGSGSSGYNVYSGSSGSGSGGGNNGVWPPPALMGLAIFTVLAFVVHPDGPTWIMLGKMRDGIHSSITNSVEYIQMVRNGTITLTPSELSGTLASIIILVTIVNHIRTNRNAGKREKDREKEREMKRDHKHHKSKHKKGKRGKGGGHGNQGGGNNSVKGRIRGGHYRASKEIYQDDDAAATTITNSTTLSKSRSRSRSSSPIPIMTQERHRCLSDMEESAVSSATSDNTLTQNSQSPVQSQPLPSVVEKKMSATANSHVQVNIPSSTSATPSPTSTSTSNSRVTAAKGSTKGTSTPEYHEDDKSISSFATAHTNHTSGSGGRRKNNRNRRGKRNTKQNNVANTNVNLAPASSTSAPTTPRGTKMKSDRSKQGQGGSKSSSSSPTTTSKKMEALAVEKRMNNRQTSHSRQEQRKASSVSATRNNVKRGVTSCKGNGGNNVSVFSNTSVTPSSFKGSSLEQNRERSFTAPNPPSSIVGARARTEDVRYHNNNSLFQNEVETMVKVDSASKVQVLEHESSSPTRTEAFVPITDLESKMISESLLNSHRKEEVEKRNGLFHRNSDINLTAAVTATPSSAQLLNYTHSSLYSGSYSGSGYTTTGNEYRPEKLELATFLSRVGLIGSICRNLLADLAGVSSLLVMTDADYDRYGIGPAKRFEIRHLLQTRNMRQQSLVERSQKTIGWNDNTNSKIRPPPGLRALSQDSSSAVIGGQRGVSLSANSTNPSQATMPLFSSNTAATSTSSNYSFSTGSSFNSLSMPPGMPQCNEDQVHCVKTAVDSSPRHNMAMLPISPLGHTIVPPGNGMNGGHFFAPKMINDEEIEADLQELGGQMAGSILDF